MNLRFNVLALAAVAPAMGIREIHYYLNGVCAETMAGGGLILVATNGHALTIARDPAGAWEGREDDKPASVLLPRDFVLALLKAHKGDGEVTITLAPVDGGTDAHVYDVSADVGAVTQRAQSIDGRYPDWRSAQTNGDKAGDLAAFDPAVLAPALDAATAIRKRAKAGMVSVQFFGAGEAATGFVLSGLEGLKVGGTVMPLRDMTEPRARLADLRAA